jgi:membrane protein YdbS with pleckstrin-like domain
LASKVKAATDILTGYQRRACSQLARRLEHQSLRGVNLQTKRGDCKCDSRCPIRINTIKLDTQHWADSNQRENFEMNSEADSPKDELTRAASEKSGDARASEPERSLWKGGFSAKAMYGTWFVCGALTVAALVGTALFARGDSAKTVWMITLALVMLMWCYAICVYVYRRLGMHYELTTQRFIHQAGVLSRTTDRIEVIDIDDVSYSQGIVQRSLGVGKIHISSSDRSHPELVLYGIDEVPKIATLIDDVRREERRRRSLHIESI